MSAAIAGKRAILERWRRRISITKPDARTTKTEPSKKAASWKRCGQQGRQCEVMDSGRPRLDIRPNAHWWSQSCLNFWISWTRSRLFKEQHSGSIETWKNCADQIKGIRKFDVLGFSVLQKGTSFHQCLSILTRQIAVKSVDAESADSDNTGIVTDYEGPPVATIPQLLLTTRTLSLDESVNTFWTNIGYAFSKSPPQKKEKKDSP